MATKVAELEEDRNVRLATRHVGARQRLGGCISWFLHAAWTLCGSTSQVRALCSGQTDTLNDLAGTSGTDTRHVGRDTEVYYHKFVDESASPWPRTLYSDFYVPRSVHTCMGEVP